MAVQGVVLAIVVGVVIGNAMNNVPPELRISLKNVKGVSNFLDWIQKNGSQKIRGDKCGNEAPALGQMAEQYECTIEMFKSKEDQTSANSIIQRSLSPVDLHHFSKIDERALAEFLVDAASKNSELSQYSTYIKNSAREVASIVKSGGGTSKT